MVSELLCALALNRRYIRAGLLVLIRLGLDVPGAHDCDWVFQALAVIVVCVVKRVGNKDRLSVIQCSNVP